MAALPGQAFLEVGLGDGEAAGARPLKDADAIGVTVGMEAVQGFVQGPQGHAARGPLVRQGQQQRAARRHVLTGQRSHLAIEVLEMQVEAE